MKVGLQLLLSRLELIPLSLALKLFPHQPGAAFQAAEMALEASADCAAGTSPLVKVTWRGLHRILSALATLAGGLDL